jgi:hypothetical protein
MDPKTSDKENKTPEQNDPVGNEEVKQMLLAAYLRGFDTGFEKGFEKGWEVKEASK